MAAFLLQLADALGQAPAFAQLRRVREGGFPGPGSACPAGEWCAADARSRGRCALRPGLDRHLARLAETRLEDLTEGDGPASADAAGIARRFMEYHLETPLSSLTAAASG